MNLEGILQRLQREYGVRQWEPGRDAASVLVGTILSQNTSDANSGRAFQSLLATFGSWGAVADASPKDISQSIRLGGLAEVKAKRIKQVLQQIQDRQGSFDLNFLSQLPLEEAKAWLKQLPGVGPKTASCVLLFSLGKPALPVDTHVFRVSKRLGLIDSKTSPELAQDLLERKVPSSYIYQFHLHLVEHGRQVCLAPKPRCYGCVLKELCPSSLSK